MFRWMVRTSVTLAAGVLLVAAAAVPAQAAPCPWSLTPTCVTVSQPDPPSAAVLSGAVTLRATAKQNEPARGNITHVEWWLYHPSFRTQNPNNEEGKVLLDERVFQPPSSGTLTDGTWRGSWTPPASRTMTARDGDYQNPGLRTYTLPAQGPYTIETHVLDAEWDRTYGGPPGRSGGTSVTIDFGTGAPAPAPSTPQDVRIGSAAFRLTGTNVYRSTGALVRYTGAGTSPANQWGFEVSLAGDGTVLARSAYRPGMAIPSGGSVLSGHDAAAEWLQTNAVVGATVTLPSSSTPAPTPAPAGSIVINGSSRRLDGTNVPRTTGALVRFSGTARSPANEWGVEVAVNSSGVIIAISRYQLGMAIPSGGYVLSGHDASAEWLDTVAQVGATVSST